MSQVYTTGGKLMATIQLNARVPRELKKAAQLAALMRGQSLSAVIREALENYVAQSNKEVGEVIRQLGERETIAENHTAIC